MSYIHGYDGGDKARVKRFVVKHLGKRPLGRQRRRFEDNIKTDVREIGYESRR